MISKFSNFINENLDKRIAVTYWDDYSDYRPQDFHRITPEKLTGELKSIYDNMKFHVGDYVKSLEYGRLFHDKIFKVDIVELVEFGRLNYHIQCIDDDSKFWVREKDIELIPDYEIAANKYNL